MSEQPPDAITTALHHAIADPGKVTPRGYGGHFGLEALYEWQARAVREKAEPLIRADERDHVPQKLSNMELRASLAIRTALADPVTDEQWRQLEDVIGRLDDDQLEDLTRAASRVYDAASEELAHREPTA